MNVADSDIRPLLERYQKFGVYGLSSNPEKPSHYVPLYMRNQGWDPVGAYPKPHSQNDFQIYKSFADLPVEYQKFANVFRASEKIPEIVDELLELGGVEVLWLQLGIQHEEAERRAEEAGLKVVSNRCLIIEHKKWSE
ncbi:MAG: CoA-binding protein [Bdellovibrionales bacterium]|nr:CoA-binding protein [Bdellovibrionales bacterium]